MKLQAFYPSRISDQVVWHTKLADELPEASASFSLAAGVITACINENRIMAYILGAYLAGARALGPAATAALDEAKTGAEGADSQKERQGRFHWGTSTRRFRQRPTGPRW